MAEHREKAVFVAVAGVLVAAALAGYLLLLGRPAVVPPPAAPPEPSPIVERLIVTAVIGPAYIRRGGTALAAKIGDELQQDDVVETGLGAGIQLSAKNRYRVDLEAHSEFTVKEITAQLSRFRLGAGLMNAQVRENGAHSFEVEAGHQAKARTQGGELSIAGDDRVAAVAVRSGETELHSGGSAVVIRPGQQSLARDGRGPAQPTAVPGSLLLKAEWPKDRVTNRRKLIVTGYTAPGAQVALDGRSVKVEPDGTFRHVVYLREGRQTISLSGRDVAGNQVQDRSPEIDVDSRGAPAAFDTEDLWK